MSDMFIDKRRTLKRKPRVRVVILFESCVPTVAMMLATAQQCNIFCNDFYAFYNM